MSASVASECNEVKDKYDACFLKWYSESKNVRHSEEKGLIVLSEFLRGTATHDECEPLFKAYKICLDVRLLSNAKFNASD